MSSKALKSLQVASACALLALFPAEALAQNNVNSPPANGGTSPPCQWNYSYDATGNAQATLCGTVTQGLPPPGGAIAPMSQSGVYNLNAASFPHVRAMLARIRTAAGRGTIIVIGDSTAVGTGTGSGAGTLTGAFVKSWPQVMAGPQLLGKAVATSVGNITGDQNVTITTPYNLYDPRLTQGASWSPLNLSSWGGFNFSYAGGAASNLAFAPAAAFDTVGIFFATNPGNGTATFNVDGGSSLGTMNASAAQGVGVASASVTGSLTTHTLNIVPSANGNFFVLAVKTLAIGTPAIDILQMPAQAAVAATFLGQSFAWSGVNIIQFLQPDLVIMDLTINDSNMGTPLATYKTQMQSLISAAKTANSDVLLMAGPPSNTVQATNGTLAQYLAVLQGLAKTNNVPFLSIPQRWTSYAVTNPIMPYADTLHPEVLGAADEAAAVTAVILTGAGAN